MKHSKLSPSSAYQWVNCPGSVMMQEKFPDTAENTAAAEGTATAWYAEQVFKGMDPLPPSAPNGVFLTTEMREAIGLYVRTVQSVTRGNPVICEHRVAIPMVHPACFGTLDACYFDVESRTLHIWDLKYGWGLVDAYGNNQLALYALGLYNDMSPDRVFVHIVQPRPYHPDGPVRSWEITRPELEDYRARLSTAAHLAVSDNPPVRTGAHCRYCSALYACITAQNACLNVLDVSGFAVSPSVPPEQIGYELTVLRRASEIITHRLAATEQRAIDLCKSGATIPGWSQTFTAGRRVWNEQDRVAIKALAEMYSVNIEKAPELLTPAQAETAGLPKDIVRMYTTTQAGKAKMEPINQDKIKRLLA